MKRKSNPWLTLIALLLMMVLIVCLCTAFCTDICTGTTEAAEKNANARFVAEVYQKEDVGGDPLRIFVLKDTETGVRYLYVQRGVSGGLIPLEEAPEEEADR